MEQNCSDLWDLKLLSATPVGQCLWYQCLWWSFAEGFAQICEMHLEHLCHTRKVPPECPIVECVCALAPGCPTYLGLQGWTLFLSHQWEIRGTKVSEILSHLGQLRTYQLITPDILISKQFLNLGTLLINFHGVWFGVFLRFWVFWVSLFVFNLDECEICLFWHGGSACPLLTIEDVHAVHQWECTLAWLVTLHSLKLAVPCSEISCVQ